MLWVTNIDEIPAFLDCFRGAHPLVEVGRSWLTRRFGRGVDARCSTGAGQGGVSGRWPPYGGHWNRLHIGVVVIVLPVTGWAPPPASPLALVGPRHVHCGRVHRSTAVRAAVSDRRLLRRITNRQPRRHRFRALQPLGPVRSISSSRSSACSVFGHPQHPLVLGDADRQPGELADQLGALIEVALPTGGSLGDSILDVVSTESTVVLFLLVLLLFPAPAHAGIRLANHGAMALNRSRRVVGDGLPGTSATGERLSMACTSRCLLLP